MTEVPLLAHLTAILEERDLRYQARFDAQEKAVVAALAAVKEASVKTDAANAAGFANVISKFDDLVESMKRVHTRLDEISGIGKGWKILIGVVGFMSTIATVYLLVVR